MQEKKILNNFRRKVFQIKNQDKTLTPELASETAHEATPKSIQEPAPKPALKPAPEQTSKPAPESAPKPATDITVSEAPKLKKAKAKPKISPLKLSEEFLNEVVDEENNVNNGIFSNYFGYFNP